MITIKVPQTEEKVRSWKAVLQTPTKKPQIVPEEFERSPSEGQPSNAGPQYDPNGPQFMEDPYLKDPYPAHWVYANGTFAERVAYYNDEIAKIRKKVIIIIDYIKDRVFINLSAKR